MSRITTNHIKRWLDTWNENHPECKMKYTANLGYVGIGLLLEHGAIHTLVSGSNAREAWEAFSAWRDGYLYAKEKMNG